MAIIDQIYRLLETQPVDSDKVAIIDEQTSTIAYLGMADAESGYGDAKWKIARIYRQGNQYTIEYAAGGFYNQIWNNRTTIFDSVTLANGYSLDFDGVNDVVDFGNNYGFEISQAFSISMWVKPNNIAATRCLVSKSSNDVNVWGYNIQHLVTTGQIQLQMRTPSSNTIHAFTTALTALQWQHIVVTYSGNSNINGGRCYRNAVIGDTPASAVLTNTFSNSASFVVGARNTAFPYSGKIDEVSVWNKALSQAEVDEIYNSGLPGNLLNHSAISNLQSWWRMGDDDIFPSILDSKGVINGTMTNMASDDIQTDVP